MFFCVDIEIQCRCAGFFCSDDSPRVGGVDGSTDVFIIFVKKWVRGGRSIGVIWGGGASVAGGQDFGVDVGDAWRIVGSTNGGATNVLFFCVGVCSDDGGGNGWGAMQKNRLNIGKMRVMRPRIVWWSNVHGMGSRWICTSQIFYVYKFAVFRFKILDLKIYIACV